MIEDRNTLVKITATLDKDTMALRNAKGLLKDLEAKIKGIKENNERVNS